MAQNKLFDDGSPKWDGEGADPLERYWTPDWCVKALLAHQHMAPRLNASPPVTVWEPCSGDSRIADGLRSHWERDHRWFDVIETDISPVGDRYPAVDFLDWAQVKAFAEETFAFGSAGIPFTECGPDWVVTNTPFSNAPEFWRMAWRVAQVGVAMLLPANFLEGCSDPSRPSYRLDILDEHPPATVIHLGRFNFVMPSAGKGPSKEHMWCVWRKEDAGEFAGLTRHIYHDPAVFPDLPTECFR